MLWEPFPAMRSPDELARGRVGVNEVDGAMRKKRSTRREIELCLPVDGEPLRRRRFIRLFGIDEKAKADIARAFQMIDSARRILYQVILEKADQIARSSSDHPA